MASGFVSIDLLGLCEHCGALLNGGDTPADAVDERRRCPSCEEVLGGASFGFEGDIQVRWVGEEGAWVDTRPTTDFQLGDLDVRTEKFELQSVLVDAEPIEVVLSRPSGVANALRLPSE